MGRKLGDLDARLGADARDLVAVIAGRGGAVQVDETRIAGQLDAPVAQPRRPGRDVGQRVERRGVARELRQKDGGPSGRAASARAMLS